MAIDVTVPGSPGWWMRRLFTLMEKRNRDRLDLLQRYMDGTPPLLLATEKTASVFYRFQRSSRTNFAELIVNAAVRKNHVRAIRTSADGDESGDPEAAKLWDANGLDSEQETVYALAKAFGESYVSIGIDTGQKYATICSEDPRQCITMQDPLKPWQAIAGIKVFYDEAAGRDYIYLYQPGSLHVAWSPRAGGRKGAKFSPSTYTLAPTEAEVLAGAELAGYDGPPSATFESGAMGLVRFENAKCVGEFERHTDLLDRINHMILQRLVIATMQAFKQRALELTEPLPKNDPETGLPIDYNEVFSADPGALWELPEGAKIWESTQADITGILQAVKDDVQHLSAVVELPLPMFNPESANQAAAGADLQESSAIDKAESDQRRWSRSWALSHHEAFLMMGDKVRADLGGIKVDWMPAKRVSISAAAAADSTSTLPFEDKLRLIYQMTPREIAAAKTNRADDLAFQAALAAVNAPPAPPPAAPADAAGGPPAAANGQAAPAAQANGAPARQPVPAGRANGGA